MWFLFLNMCNCTISWSHTLNTHFCITNILAWCINTLRDVLQRNFERENFLRKIRVVKAACIPCLCRGILNNVLVYQTFKLLAYRSLPGSCFVYAEYSFCDSMSLLWWQFYTNAERIIHIFMSWGSIVFSLGNFSAQFYLCW